MMKSYGTPASEGDVQRAQFLNYLKAPKPLQLAMQKFSPDSDAYRGIQNSMASAEEDLGTRLGMPAPARQWTMATAGTDRAGYGDGFAGTPGQTPPGARSLVERTVSGLPAGHPLTQMLNPQAEQQRVARRQAQEQTPVNARGVAGATFGEVNGQQMLVPQAGRYGEFQAATAALGLNGQMGVDRGAFEQKRSDLVRGQEKARRMARLEADAAATLGHTRELELKTAPEKIKASADRYTADQSLRSAGEKAERELYLDAVNRYNTDVVNAKKEYQKEEQRRVNLKKQVGFITKGLTGNTPLLLNDGTQIPKSEIEGYFFSRANLEPTAAPFETWAEQQGYQVKRPDNPFANRSKPATGTQPAAAQSGATSARPDFSGIFGNGYTDDENFQSLAKNPQAKAQAVERLKAKGMNAQADYIAGL